MLICVSSCLNSIQTLQIILTSLFLPVNSLYEDYLETTVCRLYDLYILLHCVYC